jgi:hypothetical protein
MPRVSIITGAALAVLGVIVTAASASSSFTSLIPAFIGALFIALGAAAHVKPELSRHSMHAAEALSVLAILGSVGTMLGRGASGWALFAQLATIAIAGTFLALAVRSFRAARRARSSGAPS